MNTKYKGFNIEILPDYNAEDPRAWDNYSTMICFHGRYNLGDDHGYDHRDYSGWEELKEQIMRDHTVYNILPLYLYDHGGITISTTSFHGRVPQGHARFDSGRVGWVFTSLEKMRLIKSWERSSEKRRVQMHKWMMSEIQTYDDFLRGNTWGYEITQDGEHIDSCYGYIGDTDHVVETAKSTINAILKYRQTA